MIPRALSLLTHEPDFTIILPRKNQVLIISQEVTTRLTKAETDSRER
jgi:hypothetical protein